MTIHVVWAAVMTAGLTVVVVATGTSRSVVATAVVASAIMATVLVVMLHVGWRDGCAAMLHRARRVVLDLGLPLLQVRGVLLMWMTVG
jgi:hypothetical protein